MPPHLTATPVVSPLTALEFVCTPSRVNPRDWYFSPGATVLASLPAAVDLRQAPGGFPEVYDQGALHSCTACAAAAAIHYDMRRQGRADAFLPSRMFLYFNQRKMAGTLSLDPVHGKPVEMIDCLRSARASGVCPEELWPYNPRQLDLRPSAEAYAFASQHRALAYLRVRQELAYLKACLAQGYPFLFGARIFSPFLGAQVRQTGQVPMPSARDRLLGAHALLAVGYDDARQAFIVRNSLGKGWGDGGHAYLPYAYMTEPHLTFDHWILTWAEDPRTLPATRVDGAPLPSTMALGMADTTLPAAETIPQSWRFTNPYGPLSNPLVMAGDRLVSVSGSTLFAVDIYRGKEAGTSDEVAQQGFPYTFQSFYGSDPHVTVGGGVVYFMDGDSLMALQLSDGQPVEGWVPPTLPQVSSLAVQEGTLVAVNLDPGTGATQMTGFDAVSGASEFGPVTLTTQSAGQVGYGQGAAFFVADGALNAVNTDFGDPRWQFTNTTGGVLDATTVPGITSSRVVTASGVLHGIDLVTGKQKWQVAPSGTASAAWSSPALDATETFGVASNTAGEVVAFSLDDGSVLWRTPVEGAGAVTLQGSTAYVSSDSGQTITVLDAETGEYSTRYALPGLASQTAPAVGNGTLYVPTDDGSIVAMPFSEQAAAYFDGVRSRVDIAADGTQFDFGLEDFTVEAWVKSSQGGEIISSYPTAGGEDDHGFRLNLGSRGELQLAVINASGSKMNIGATVPTQAVDGEWHHLALIRRSGELTAMVDGMSMQLLVPSDPDDPLSIGGKNALTLGAYVPGPGLAAEDHFAGLMREVRIWDRALDVATLQSNLVRELTGQEPRLLGYWRLDENHAAATNDARPEVPPLEPRSAVVAHRYTAVFRYAASCPSDLLLDRSAFPYLLHEVEEQWPYSGTWAARGEEPALTPAALSDNEALAFGTENALYGVRRADGHRLWGIDVDEGTSAPVAFGNSFFALTGQESLIVIDAQTGDKAQVPGFNALITQAAETLAAPAVTSQWLAAASPSGELRIQNRTSEGQPVVKTAVGANPTSLAFNGSTLVLIAGSEGARKLYAIDPASGSSRTFPVASDSLCAAGSWVVCVGPSGLQRVDPGQATLTATASTAAIAPQDITGLAAFPDRNLLAVSTASGTLYGLSLATLAPRWQYAVPQGTAGTSRVLNPPEFDEAGRVFVTSRSGAVVAVDSNDGSLCGLYFAPQPVLTQPALHAGTVLYACADPEDAAAAIDGAMHSVVFGETTVLRLGLDAAGSPLSETNAYGLVEQDAADATLHLMDVNRCCVEAWINVPAQNGGGGILSVCPTDAGGFDVNLWLDADGTLHFTARCREEDGWRMLTAQAPTSLCDGRWHHVAISRESEDHAVLYVDGAVLEDVQQQLTMGASPSALVPGLKVYLGALGGDDHSATRAFRGLIGEVRIWDTYLVAPELASRMHVKLRGDEPDLLAFWNFDRSSIHDGARQGHDGVLVNAGTAPSWWLTELPFEHPSYPFLTTAAVITQEGEAGQTDELAKTVYELTLKACRADGAGLPNHPIELWYVQHEGDPGTIEVSGTTLQAVSTADERDEAGCSFTTGSDGTLKVLVKTGQLGHGPTLDVRAGFMPSNERFHVNTLLDNQKLAKPAPPTLTVQTKLIQDYHYSDGGKIDETRDRSTWRTVIKATNPDTTGRANEPITLWAEIDLDLEVAGTTYHVNATNSATFYADGSGELTVVSAATDLSTPNLYARAGFMHRNDRIVIAPDQDLHQQLGAVQGSDLTQSKVTNWTPASEQGGGQTTLLGSDDSGSSDQTAEAIRHIVAAAPPPASTSTSTSASTGAGAASATLPALDESVTQQELEAMRQPKAGPRLDAVVPLRTLGHVRRRAPVNPDGLRASLGEHLGFVFEAQGDSNSLRFEKLATQEDVDRERGTATSTATSTALGFSLKKAWKTCKHVVHDPVGTAKDIYKEASKVVVSVVGDTVQVALHWAEGVYQSTIKSIGEAFAAVGSFFAQLGKELMQVIQYLRELLNWGGFIKTHRIIKSAFKACMQAVSKHMKDEAAIRGAFQAIRAVLGGEATDVSSTSMVDVQSQTADVDNPAMGHADSVKGKMTRQKSTERKPTQVNKPASGDMTASPLEADFGTVMSELLAIGSDLKSMSLSALLSDLLRLVKTLALTVLDTVVEGIVTVSSALATAIDWLVQAMDATLHIPWVSALYKWLTGDELSVLDLLCLAAAIPVNLVYSVMSDLRGAKREFYETNYGMPDAILSAAGLPTGSSSALGMGTDLSEDAGKTVLGDQTYDDVAYATPSYASTDSMGFECLYLVLRLFEFAFSEIAESYFIGTLEARRGSAAANAGGARDFNLDAAIAFVKFAKGLSGLGASALLFFYSDPRVQARLVSSLKAAGADSREVEQWWAASSIASFAVGATANVLTIGGAIKSFNAAAAEEFGGYGGTFDAMQYQAQRLSAFGKLGYIIYKIVGMGLHASLMEKASSDVRNEVYLLDSRNIIYAFPKLFDWMFTDTAASDITNTEQKYLAAFAVRTFAPPAGLIFHSVGVFGFDKEL
ncbi:MAG TPA: LamG-like jellyroll fold domain-containing protein [Myxococcaceae bacterium]|jgi:outer membrane protein assembly factor BamB